MSPTRIANKTSRIIDAFSDRRALGSTMYTTMPIVIKRSPIAIYGTILTLLYSLVTSVPDKVERAVFNESPRLFDKALWIGIIADSVGISKPIPIAYTEITGPGTNDT